MNFARIISNIIYRAGGAVSYFLVHVLVSRYLGAEGRGMAAIFVLNSVVIQLAAQIIAGSSVSYFAPRLDNRKLLSIAWMWNAGISVLAFIILSVIPINPVFILPVTLNVFFFTGLLIHQVFLLSRKKLQWYNLLLFLPHLNILVFILLIREITGTLNLEDVMWSYNISMFVWMLISGYACYREEWLRTSHNAKEVFRTMLHYGGVAQLANTFQLLSYRVTFYILNSYHGDKNLGIYTNAVVMAESIWIIARAGSSVLYSDLVNSTDKQHNREATQQLAKRILLISAAALAALCILPDGIYTAIFGKDFTGIQECIWFLAPGVLAMSAINIYAHYFSGTGKVQISTFASLISMITCTLGGFLFIPAYGRAGAGMATSLAFVLAAVFLFYWFGKRDHRLTV